MKKRAGMRTPIHPGAILADELAEIGISAAELARLIEVPANRVSQIIAGKRAITADTALRLAHCVRAVIYGDFDIFLARFRRSYKASLSGLHTYGLFECSSGETGVGYYNLLSKQTQGHS